MGKLVDEFDQQIPPHELKERLHLLEESVAQLVADMEHQQRVTNLLMELITLLIKKSTTIVVNKN